MDKDVGWPGRCTKLPCSPISDCEVEASTDFFQGQVLQPSGCNDACMRLTVYSWLLLSVERLLVTLCEKCDSLLHVGVGRGRGKAQG